MTALSVMADTVAWHGPWFGPWFLLIPLGWILVLVLGFSFARRFWWHRYRGQFQGYRGESQGWEGQGWDAEAREPQAGEPQAGEPQNYDAQGYGYRASGAEAVLRERYARGEIDEAEYRQRLEVLRAEQGS